MGNSEFNAKALRGEAALLGKSLSRYDADQFREVGAGRRGYHCVHDLPFPASGGDPLRERYARIYLEGCLLYLKAIATSYATENRGEAVRSVKPKASHGDEASTAGAGALPAHTDMAYLTFAHEQNDDLAAAPDFLILSCVRNDPKVPTRMILVERVLAELEDRHVATLKEPRFTISTPETVKPVREFTNCALLHDPGAGEALMMRYRADRVTGEDTLARAALEALNTAVERDDLGKDVVLQPGSLLAFDNRRVLHARPPIDTDAAAGKRALLRLYGQRADTRILNASGDGSRLNQLS